MYELRFSYVEGDSILHRLEERVKTICAFTIILGITLLKNFYTVFSILVISFLLMIYVKAPVSVILKRFRYPFFIASFIMLIQFFTYGSSELVTLGFLRIYEEGLSFGILLFLRIMAAVSVLNLLILVTPVNKILGSLKWFRVPKILLDISMLMLRYIFVLSEESTRIYYAQQSRGGYTGNYRKKIENFGVLGGMVILRSLDRVTNVYKAMISRGYNENIGYYSESNLSKRDLLLGISIVLLMIFFVTLEYTL
ncbi:MAG: cobalt ECF transporter T component CbiQ [Candidatus Hydrothermarchaeota archaeon]